MGLKENIAKVGNNLKNVIQNVIDPQQMRELARKSNFVQRCSGRLNGDEFVQALLIESVDGEKSTLRGIVDTLAELKSKAKMSVPAIRKRINSKGAALLIEGVFKKTLLVVMTKMNTLITITKRKMQLLEFFPNVYLQDSTESLLDAELKDDYKGSGGGNGNGKGDSSFKIDLIYEYKSKSLSYLKVTDRREPDSILGKQILEIIRKGDLVIRDLGYSCINVFQEIQDIGAYFLSRLHGSLNVYLNPLDTQPVCIGSFLEKKTKKSGVVDTVVYIGRQMFQCRLIAYRVPPEMEKERCKEYLKECKKRKRKPNKEYMRRFSFTIFITNVPTTIWLADVVGTIYRLRWQVELIFKSWKSELKFDFLAGTNVFRITCLIYARLTAILMMFTVYACIDNVALELLEKEISIHKIIDWLTRNGRFIRIVVSGFCKKMWNCLLDSERILCKERRKKRQTTRELVENAVFFGSSTC